jgi:peptide/nickel transport system substrate-binding protein
MFSSRRVISVGAVLVGAALLVSACAASDETASQTDGSEPTVGGTLTFLESQVPTCFYAGGGGFYPNATLINQLADKLTYQDPETREITPWLATSWQINDDATEYVFELRDDVTFSDGTPLTADVVALNFDHFGLGDEELGLAKQEFVSNYDASEVINENTVKFTFTEPTPGFLQATSVVGAAIVAESTATLPYEEQCQIENFVATGPFTVSNVVPEQQYDLAAREDYDWAPEVDEHQGRAYLDAISVIVTPEDNVRIGALTSGQADAIRAVQVYDVDNIEATGSTVYYAPTNGVNPQFALRPDHPILADLAVRQALQKATDVETAIETIYLGKFDVATSVLSQGATGYVDLSDKLGYDLEGAKALLEEAGWAVGADGIREKDGERLTLTTWPGAVFPLNQQLDELIAEQWKLAGVELDIVTPDQATQTAGSRDPLQQPVAITHVGRVDPDVIWSNFGSNSNRNALGVTAETADPELDAILTDVTRLATSEERYAKAAEAQEYLIDQAYVIPLYELPQTYAAQAHVQGLRWEAVGRVDLTDVWLTQ